MVSCNEARSAKERLLDIHEHRLLKQTRRELNGFCCTEGLRCFLPPGLLGGAVYVNAFTLISKSIDPRYKEFSLAAASLGDSLGIAFADVVGILIQVFFDVPKCVTQSSCMQGQKSGSDSKIEVSLLLLIVACILTHIRFSTMYNSLSTSCPVTILLYAASLNALHETFVRISYSCICTSQRRPIRWSCYAGLPFQAEQPSWRRLYLLN